MTEQQRKSINSIIQTTPDCEDETTQNLFSLSLKIKKQGHLTKDQAISILKWKSPRPLKYYNMNSDEDFTKITRLSFTQKDEKIKIHILTALIGVKYPAASALLMFYDKTQYPIIDIRVWKQLYKNNLLTENPNGQAFTLGQWNNYLTVIRQIANENGLTARQIEKRLFDYDRKTQRGTLYKKYDTR